MIPKNDKKKKHTINSIDNMIRKVKIYFIKFLVNLTNNLIKKLIKNENYFLKHITSDIAADVIIDLNYYLKEFTVQEILSLPLKEQYSKLKLIQKI